MIVLDLFSIFCLCLNILSFFSAFLSIWNIVIIIVLMSLFSNSNICINFFFDVWSYLFVTVRTSHFWLDSDLEVEALREDSLQLLAVCSWHFSLASFILLAKSLAYSAASPLFFVVRCFFRAIHRRLSCRTRGVTRCWILGALVLGFLPSLFRGFLTTYWWTSSSLERLKNLQILLALWGPRQRGTLV